MDIRIPNTKKNPPKPAIKKDLLIIYKNEMEKVVQ